MRVYYICICKAPITRPSHVGDYCVFPLLIAQLYRAERLKPGANYIHTVLVRCVFVWLKANESRRRPQKRHTLSLPYLTCTHELNLRPIFAWNTVQRPQKGKTHKQEKRQNCTSELELKQSGQGGSGIGFGLAKKKKKKGTRHHFFFPTCEGWAERCYNFSNTNRLWHTNKSALSQGLREITRSSSLSRNEWIKKSRLVRDRSDMEQLPTIYIDRKLMIDTQNSAYQLGGHTKCSSLYPFFIYRLSFVHM